MRFIRTKATLAAVGLSLSLAACGGEDSEGIDTADVEAAGDLSGTPKELSDAGTIKIGVKYDQPGIGYKEPGSDVPSGMDIEMGRIVAARLGIADDDIEWVETISDNREPFLEDGTVDLVLASYSITDERRQVVGQAGPYLVTGQQLLVGADSDIESVEDVKGEEVCSVTGSTSLDNIEAEGAKPVGFDTYSECVEKVLDGTVAAMSTDGTILAGYAAQNEGDLKVVGDEFSEERIGVGYSIDRPEMCQWIVDTITEAYDDGTYEEAFNSTLGPSGVEVPELPEMDACEE